MSDYDDYPTEPIGGGNPYRRCKSCKRSAPEINGRLEKHETWCEYRRRREAPAAFQEIPQLPQRQDSTSDQLEDLVKVAERLGMYDAADYIRNRTR